MSCLVTAVEMQEGTAAGKATDGDLLKVQASNEVTGTGEPQPPSDLNSLLETGSVLFSEGIGLCDDEVVVPLCGVKMGNGRLLKHSSRQRVLGTAGEETLEEQDSTQMVDRPPAGAKLKLTDVPRVVQSDELPFLLSRVQISQCPKCFNLSDDCGV